jgi:7-cyano-7-deazaguanine synthase
MQKKIYKKGLVVFSGGQDSTTCLQWAINRYQQVYAITFNYKQRHNVEIKQSKIICDKLGICQVVVDIDFLDVLCESALLKKSTNINDKHVLNDSLPSSFVPNRNALFLTLAHSYAQKIQVQDVITGTCQTDYSGFPDCREIFIKNLQHSLNLGADTDINFVTPLMHINKAETFKLAEKENALDLILNYSHTCYEGSDIVNEWGRGCGKCPACKLRKKGFYEYKKNE